MDWTVVRLRVNDYRGRAGDLVEVPAELARDMVREGRATKPSKSKARRDDRVKDTKDTRSC